MSKKRARHINTAILEKDGTWSIRVPEFNDAANGVWIAGSTGDEAWHRIEGEWDRIIGAVQSSIASTTGGFVVQQSLDKVNVLISTTLTIQANATTTFDVRFYLPYIRIRYQLTTYPPVPATFQFYSVLVQD